jgi:endoglucanase
LRSAGVARADGFSTNVSNFNTTTVETQFGKDISAKLSGAHFVIDTSRNSADVNGEWCNPQKAAIGAKPSLETGDRLVDAYLWIKTPGESDGNCNGGPNAGVWWTDYAVKLVQNAH